MHVSTILSALLFLLPLTTLAKLNGPCTGAANKPGVCIKTSSCTSGGGTYISGACPNDPNDVKCCTKASCGSGGGTCKFADKCESGSTQTGLCPGPSDFKCCLPKSGGSGFPPPHIPGVGACKKVAVEGAKKIVAKNKGKVREIGCVRNCKCGAAGASDHCCGLAIDLMCSKAAGVSSFLFRCRQFLSLVFSDIPSSSSCTGSPPFKKRNMCVLIRFVVNIGQDRSRQEHGRMGDAQPRQPQTQVRHFWPAHLEPVA